LFKPNFIFSDVTEITTEFLKSNNIKALLLDVDNTLTVEHKSFVLKDGVEEWLNIMNNARISLIIVSNAKRKRASALALKLKLPFISMALKPLPFGYVRAYRKIGTKKEQTAMVGDQLFTDVLGANFIGLKSILVTDITPEDSLSFRIRRRYEKKILKEIR
jgi:HAD superfamily phosphatase (TIGR01668 family)